MVEQLNLAHKVIILGQPGNIYEINSSESINQATPVIVPFVSQCSYRTHIFASW